MNEPDAAATDHNSDAEGPSGVLHVACAFAGLRRRRGITEPHADCLNSRALGLRHPSPSPARAMPNQSRSQLICFGSGVRVWACALSWWARVKVAVTGTVGRDDLIASTQTHALPHEINTRTGETCLL